MIQILCLIAACMFGYAGVTTLTQGFKVSTEKIVTGGAAYVISAILFLIAIGFVVFGLFILPNLLT